MTTVIDTEALDRAVAELRDRASSWTDTPLPARIALLERMLPRIGAVADAMCADAARAKGYPADSTWAAEDWTGGPWALAQNVQTLLRTLRRIAATGEVVPPHAVHTREDRVVVDVFPATRWDRLLLNGYHAEVWMAVGSTTGGVRASAGTAYSGRRHEPRVALVLGAGNVAAITALDILHKLYVEGQVVLAKMNPVNAYLRPHIEQVFVEFTERGWLRFADGGTDEGAFLTRHPGIDTLHITGSARTHDAIVWGIGPDAERRRDQDRPLVAKPFSSELGGVSPCIVVPGRWSAADFRYQAEHIVTSKMNNSGHNCIASQVLVLPRDWDGTEKLLAEIRRVLRALPPRPDYYPGAPARLQAVRDAHPGAEVLGEDCSRLLVEIGAEDPLLRDEVFASALGVVRLSGATAEDFLPRAVAFANDTLPGTLGATLVVHPRTERHAPGAVGAAIGALRYGTLGVNCWSGVGFLLGTTPWGAYPGHTRQDIGSGVGLVHNAYLLADADVEKTVLRAPFAPAPRGLLTGSPSLSPRPPYFVTNRTALTTVKRLTAFTLAPSLRRLPAILASALRG
ncbi:aldehyde dehydrogenase family protein [Streptacidiphilus jiangxiensis]|uniref:Aldehyde dehydrogenase family protein n=1 Tax=Streptacidiphilus jiangxiensis TaxID=235985 RepID=A0A1H7ZY24_STRJI|nr:aldehyde dehydrogenase family protein [Streptacidiphilus jiangxiensis]SEM63375.1 Aldehyde dehydrogenase family protein [Streptacidiphilus jiangxiensis]